jgi:hypothetical protein
VVTSGIDRNPPSSYFTGDYSTEPLENKAIEKKKYILECIKNSEFRIQNSEIMV